MHLCCVVAGRICICLFLFLCLQPSWTVDADDDRTAERLQMVAEQIESRGVKDPATLAAMRSVPRHHFVPAAQKAQAYEDRPLPIGYGQTISQPLMVAIMTELVKPRPDIKVLEIGTGSGYQAAILASAGAEVYSVEILSELAASARDRLERLGYRNVSVKNADGYHGWPEAAPFDAIIVTAAAEFIPPPLVKQLAEGAIMIIPVGSPFHVQTLMMVQMRDGKPYTTSLMPVMFVPFTRAGQ